MKRLFTMALIVGATLMAGCPSQAQIPVIDAANLAENTISSIQSVIQTVQQILMVASWTLDLAALGEDSLGGGFAEDVNAIMGLVGDVNALSYDISQLNHQLQALFSLETAPISSLGMQQRSVQVRLYMVQAYSYAMRTQTLLMTLRRTLEHLMSITERIGELFGTVSAQQNGQQYLAKITQLETQTAMQAAAFQRAQSTREIDPAIEVQTIENIKVQIRIDMPR